MLKIGQKTEYSHYYTGFKSYCKIKKAFFFVLVSQIRITGPHSPSFYSKKTSKFTKQK